MKLPDLIDQIKSQPRLFIRFHASWCGVCKLLDPHVNSLKSDEALADVTFIDVDVEEHLDVKQAFKINDLPYFAGFKDGKLIEEFATAKKDKVSELAQACAS
jgi:thioredoxin-like negative regulator of GroEL